MLEDDTLTLEKLAPILGSVVLDNREKVQGWMRDESGCWGYLAGKAVTATRDRLGRPLNDGERRLVWHRLWWVLENVKREALS
jgi:hypothetical protein